MNIFVVLEKIATIFLLIFIGFIFGKSAKTSEAVTSSLSKIVLNLAVPAAILAGADGADFGAIHDDVLMLMLIATGIVAATLIISLIAGRLLEPQNKLSRAVVQTALFFNNFSFMGWPVCYVLLGEQGLLYAVLFSMPLNLLIYGITPMLLKSQGGQGRLFDKKMLINLPMWAAVAGLAMMMLNLELPEFVSGLMGILGASQTPLAMLVIGMILATADLKLTLKGFKVYGYSLVRLILLPLLAFFALKWIGFSGLLLSVPVLITAMPAGAMSAVMVKQSGLDGVYASRLVIVSTLLSILTIPAMAMLIL